MKIILTTILLLTALSCTKKCEFTASDEYESGTYCYSDDGSFYEDFESYWPNYEYDENWNLIETTTTNDWYNSGNDESLFTSECKGEVITYGSCE